MTLEYRIQKLKSVRGVLKVCSSNLTERSYDTFEEPFNIIMKYPYEKGYMYQVTVAKKIEL